MCILFVPYDSMLKHHGLAWLLKKSEVAVYGGQKLDQYLCKIVLNINFLHREQFAQGIQWFYEPQSQIR